MAITVSQILASSYESVKKGKPENQWHDASGLQLLEKNGMVERINGAPSIEVPVDYQINPDADFLATDFDPVGMSPTNVITSAIYTPAQLQVPIKWSKATEAQNPTENQKIDLVASLLDNAFASHDELIEQKLFAAATYNGFLPLPILIPTGGQSTIGGIDASVETWWRNPATTYNTNFSDIETILTTLYNQVLKGSMSKYRPKVLIGSADAQAGFEALQVAVQRHTAEDGTANAGFKVLKFKGIDFGFSAQAPTATDPVYMLGGGFSLKLFKNAYRMKGETRELESATGYICQIYSALQATVGAKSRLAVASHA